MKKLILLLSVLLVVSCIDRPDCINTNEIFNKYSPNIKEYKDELVNQLRLIDNTKLKYWIKEYEVIEEEEFIYFYIQGDGLCAIIEINTTPEKINKETELTYNGLVPVHTEIGLTHTGIEFMNLTFNIKQDSLNTEFIFRDYERRGFD
jgi:hypothetical protein|tara:strand:+ start:20 stop:463 length:444 start_codon:yes stop_codon:yes gene_type:complete